MTPKIKKNRFPVHAKPSPQFHFSPLVQLGTDWLTVFARACNSRAGVGWETDRTLTLEFFAAMRQCTGTTHFAAMRQCTGTAHFAPTMRGDQVNIHFRRHLESLLKSKRRKARRIFQASEEKQGAFFVQPASGIHTLAPVSRQVSLCDPLSPRPIHPVSFAIRRVLKYFIHRTMSRTQDIARINLFVGSRLLRE